MGWLGFALGTTACVGTGDAAIVGGGAALTQPCEDVGDGGLEKAGRAVTCDFIGEPQEARDWAPGGSGSCLFDHDRITML
jgi:hypothetical protein